MDESSRVRWKGDVFRSCGDVFLDSNSFLVDSGVAYLVDILEEPGAYFIREVVHRASQSLKVVSFTKNACFCLICQFLCEANRVRNGAFHLRLLDAGP